MGFSWVNWLFPKFEVNNQYTFAGCNESVKASAIREVGPPRPLQNPRQRDLGFSARPKECAQFRSADRREHL